MRRIMFWIAAAPAICLPAAAASPADLEERYIMERTQGGFFRTDRQTGVASFCRPSGANWICTLVPDDLEAFESEITRLNSRVAALEKTRDAMQRRIRALEGDGGDTASTRRKGGQMDKRDGIDRTMEQAEAALRGFLAVMLQLRQAFQ